MKGYIQGSLWGLVCGGVGLGIASVSVAPPNFATGPAAPEMAAPDIASAVTDTTVAVPTASSPATLPEVADPMIVATPDADASPDMSTDTAAVPDVGATAEAAPAAASPQVAEDAPLVSTTQDDTPPNAAPPEITVQEPVAEVAADVMTQQPAPEPEPEPEPEPAPAPEPASAPVPEPAPAEAPVVVAAQPEIAETPQDETPEAQTAVVTPDPTENAADAAPEAAAPPAQQPVTTDQPTIIAQALPQASGGVRINRPVAAPAAADAGTDTPPDVPGLTEDAPALTRYAAFYEPTAGVPQIAVMLIDNDATTAETSALTDLGFVPTVAINALADGAGDKMAAYRAAGLEVAVQADLPSGAQPVDVEVAFAAALQLLPQAAMVFSTGTGAIQDRAVTAQVLQILAADGLGFVTIQRGLSDATRGAEQAGVPAATITRDLDGDAAAMVRALDQAAFRARQTGNVVVLGQMTPETVAALREWAAGVDQQTLSIAPVSAILLSQSE